MESKCDQEKGRIAYTFFSCPGRYFRAIVIFTARIGAGVRVAKSRQLKVKVKYKALLVGIRTNAEIKFFLL